MNNKIIKVHSIATLSAVDGPGIRCTVFLAGCPLRCAYCHNPDTWNAKNSTAYTTDELLVKLMRYAPYFGDGGGVTFSGGEPFVQAEAMLDLIQKLKENNIHVAIDTAGCVSNSFVEDILKMKPLLLLDIKMPDEARYEHYIGGTLRSALQTLALAEKYGCEIWIRYVVVPTLNDAPEDIMEIIDIANRHKNVTNLSLLPYHTMGVSKYEALGMAYTLKTIEPPDEEQMRSLNTVVKSHFHAGRQS
ncbi:MAG: pyruvate formate lyase-activating protein [Oscillospiraceae bacterium]|nr:pyruvate formate lyase-activating protein [Oscillospiraceae bacterium]